MVQDKLQTYLKSLVATPSHFQGLGQIWALCIANMALIALLGGMIIFLSGRSEIFFMTLTIMVSAGTMVSLLLIKFQRLKFTAQKQKIEAKAYELIQSPLLILKPDLHFCYGNRKARDECWWAENIPFLEKNIALPKNRAALERLVESFYQKEEKTEILHLRGRHEDEVWQVHSLPLGENSLWQCFNVTHERGEESRYLTQCKQLALFLDHADEGLFSLNEKGNVLFCNKKFSKWLGYSWSEIVGSSLSKFIVKPRSQDPLKLSEIQGKCDFITSSSRIKSAFLEQKLIPTEGGFITYSLLNLYTPFANQSDMSKVLEMTPLPVICLDENGQIQDSNILFRERFWLERASIRGTSFLNLVADFQKEEVKNALHNFLNGNNEGANAAAVGNLNDVWSQIPQNFIQRFPMLQSFVNSLNVSPIQMGMDEIPGLLCL